MKNQITNQNNLNNFNRTLIFIFVITLTISCQTNNKKTPKTKSSFHTIKGIGKVKKGTYTFCGTVPTEVNYSYRKGKWIFITDDKIKIAEGEYYTTLIKDNSSGGCEIEYFESTIDLKKWKFWGIDGKDIKPNEQLISLIESKKTTNIISLK
ncbi:hypothetical protein [uncultured Aquimarina sp.]|uniref:hypothetical protein n=1 Tax=uncultured Aquimarina sp. TaxID=575652 RepID=UPI00261748B1|nr:hypothetical protein [uncultured Aquimarina sp.]